MSGWPTAEWDGEYPTHVGVRAEIFEASVPVDRWEVTRDQRMVLEVGKRMEWPIENFWEGFHAEFQTVQEVDPGRPGWLHTFDDRISEYVGGERVTYYSARVSALAGFLFIREARPDRLRATYFVYRWSRVAGGQETGADALVYILHLDAVAKAPHDVTERVDRGVRAFVQSGGLLSVAGNISAAWTRAYAADADSTPVDAEAEALAAYDAYWPWDSITDPDIRDRLYRAYSPGDLWPGGADDTADTGAASDTGAPTDTATPSP